MLQVTLKGCTRFSGWNQFNGGQPQQPAQAIGTVQGIRCDKANSALGGERQENDIQEGHVVADDDCTAVLGYMFLASNSNSVKDPD